MAYRTAIARELVAAAPGDGLGHTLLGFGHLAPRDAANARAAFEAALRINPANLDARNGLSEVAKICQ